MALKMKIIVFCPAVRICLVGDRLMELPHDMTNFTDAGSWCTKNLTGDLHHRYCTTLNDTTTCDPFYESAEVQFIPGIPGIPSGVIVGRF